MKLNLRVLGSMTAMAILVLAFQNCSPVSFDAETRIVGKNETGAAPIDDNLQDGNDIRDDYDYTDNNINNPSVPPRSGDIYRALCAETPNLNLPAGADLSGQADPMIVKVPSLKTVSGNAGRVVVMNDGTDTGTINSVFGNAGEVIICGFNVKVFAATAGDIILVNSHIEKVMGNSGLIRLVDSTVDLASGNAGDIKVETLK